MKIHILRHAKTNQESKSGKDFDRELLPKGEKQALEISKTLQNLNNCEVHCSSSTRTRQTLSIVAQKINFSSIHFSDELYLCSSKDILNYVNDLSSKSELLILGHNNGLSDFASYLSDKNINLQTAGYCCIECDIKDWSELSFGTGKIIQEFRPEV
ncbi:MAG: histidine phosphatase family protein [Bacteroidota bacterium]